MKKLLSIILSTMLFLSVFYGNNFTVSGAENLKSSTKATYGDFEYTILADGTAEITKYKGDDIILTIPNTISGYEVTSIADEAFAHCSRLTNITIPDSVTNIGDEAFCWCSSLTSITIPNSVTNIGDGAFSKCFNLTSIAIPDSVTSIGDSTFYCCDRLTNITIPNSATSIGDSAFRSCYKLTSITIPDSVTSIGGSAFYGCDSLTSITIPDSVTSIGGTAFYSCGSLTSITIPDSVTSIGSWAFSNCDSLTSITIPDSVTKISGYTFSNCDRLTSIIIPNSVTNIGDGAFLGCKALSNITLPNAITRISKEIFYKCERLTSITIPNSVETIEKYAFYGCTSLASIKIPNIVTNIGYGVFLGCNKLKSIHIDNYNCTIYDSEATIPSDTTICCFEGSSAYEYALKYDRKFELINHKDHIWDDGTIIQKASCTKPGKLEFQCIYCSEKKIETVKALGHKIVIDKPVEPTCTKSGLTKGKHCSRCGEVLVAQKVVKKKNHKNQKLKIEYFTNGYEYTTYCSDCGKVINKGIAYIKAKIKTPTFTAKEGKNKIIVKYNKVKEANGYQIKYKKGNTAVTKTYNSPKSAKRILKNIEKGTYKVYVRAFTKQNGKRFFSHWSKARIIKVT